MWMERGTLTVSEFKEVLRRESERKKLLISATIELTSKCCFKCSHCYIDNTKIGYISSLSFERMLKELKTLGCVYLTLTGGEAILHPNFAELYNTACKYGFIITLFTNGYMLDRYIDLLAQHKPYEIDITLYGVDQSTYFNSTNVDTSCKVLENLKILRDKGITFSLKAAVTRNIFPLLTRMQDIARDYNATFRFDPYIFLSQDQCQKVERLSPCEIANLMTQNPEYIELERNHMVKRDLCSDHKCYNCKPGETSVYITWDERVKMCPFTSDEHSICISNQENGISMARKMIQDKFSFDIPKESKCYDCRYESTCRRCPERFFIESGDYEKPAEWMCKTAQRIYEIVNRKSR